MKATVMWRRAPVSEDGRPNLTVTALQIAQIGKRKTSHLVTGTQQGSLEFLPLFPGERSRVIECHGSPITKIFPCDICSLGMDDLVVGDAAGMLQVFSADVRVSSQSTGSSISSILLDADLYGNSSLVCGDVSGALSSFSPLIAGEKNFKAIIGPHSSAISASTKDWTATDLISYNALSSETNLLSHYTVVVTNTNTLYFYSGSSKIFSLDFPAPVLCACSGYFKEMEKGGENQLAVALENGSVFLVANFESQFWFDADLTFTKIAALKMRTPTTQSIEKTTDILLAIGHFNSVVAYQNGQQVLSHETSDWVHQLSVSPLVPPTGTQLPAKDYVAIATVDNAIELLELSFE